MDLIIVLSSGSEADLVLYVYKIVNVDWTDRIDLNYIFILSPPCYWAEHHWIIKMYQSSISLSLSIMKGHTLH